MREGFGRMERETKGEKRKGGKRKREKRKKRNESLLPSVRDVNGNGVAGLARGSRVFNFPQNRILLAL